MADYFGRDGAPFGAGLWKALDETVIGAAKAQLSGRKILDIDGPYGLGLKAIPLADEAGVDDAVRLSAAKCLPVSLLETTFVLGARDIAASEASGLSLNLEAAASAGMRVAQAEEALIFEGNKALCVDGLLTTAGTQSAKLSAWTEVGAAAQDIIAAVTAMDAAGFHGPYDLALAPALHNLLYRLYAQGGPSELGHVKEIVGGSVVKALGIKKGGVLIASGKQFTSLVVGQDMAVGFVGPVGSDYEFKVAESLAVMIRVPAAVCVLKA